MRTRPAMGPGRCGDDNNDFGARHKPTAVIIYMPRTIYIYNVYV